MRIAVFGTGMVGRALAERLDEVGHRVTVGTRDVAATLERGGEPSFADWAGEHEGIGLATFADAASGAELAVLAVGGSIALATLEAAGAANLAGKVLLDISNPLDFSQGFPPTLFVKDSDSLGERIQAAFPELKVVKSLNTMTADLMVRPGSLADGDHSVFLSGDDAEAKRTVGAMLESFGHTDVIDLGDITTARGTEMLLPIWLRLMGALGTSIFNFKVVR